MLDNERRKRGNAAFYVLFVGLLTYAPNVDALYTICNKIAPNFGNDVKFLGYVDDVKKYILESDICMAPLRYGSGTRFKILEYMAMGKPVISTAKGVEGVDYIPNKDVIIEDNIDAFSERIQELLEDKRKREDIGENAMELIKQKYDWKIYQKTLHGIYDAIG